MHTCRPNEQIIEKILRECGAILLDCLAEGRTEGNWIDTQFKATADDVAHNFLISSLVNAFPGVPVISEEDRNNNIFYERDHFIIDPIDGTASFAQGFNGWVTQVAYISNGIPVMAGIYAPASNEYFSASRKKGAYCNGYRLNLEKYNHKHLCLIDNYPQPKGLALELMKALQINKYMESGSIALKICRIADGSADLFIKDMTPMDWDLAAPMLVLAEAGGFLTDVNGVGIKLGSKDRRHQGLIAAANPFLAQKVKRWVHSFKKT